MKKILFVCEGNTCRSPMAACMAKAMKPELQVASAGLRAFSNAPTSRFAMEEMKRRGLSLAEHRSVILSYSDVKEADLVVAMNEQMAERIRMFFPNGKTVSFSPPIFDPFGGTAGDYRKCADLMADQLPVILK